MAENDQTAKEKLLEVNEIGEKQREAIMLCEQHIQGDWVVERVEVMGHCQ